MCGLKGQAVGVSLNSPQACIHAFGSRAAAAAAVAAAAAAGGAAAAAAATSLFFTAAVLGGSGLTRCVRARL